MAENGAAVNTEDLSTKTEEVSESKKPKKNRHRSHRKKSKSQGENPEAELSPTKSGTKGSTPKAKIVDKNGLNSPKRTPKNDMKADGQIPKAKIADKNGLRSPKRTPKNHAKSDGQTPKRSGQNAKKTEQNARKSDFQKYDNRARNRKNSEKSGTKFPDYYLPEVVEIALKGGSLVSGILRIHPKNYEEAYISSPDGKSDICVQGLKNRNRALHGDKVAIDLYPESEWMVCSGQLRDFQMLMEKSSELESSESPELSEKSGVAKVNVKTESFEKSENSELSKKSSSSGKTENSVESEIAEKSELSEEIEKLKSGLSEEIEKLKLEDLNNDDDADIVIEKVEEIPTEKSKKTRRSPRKKKKNSNNPETSSTPLNSQAIQKRQKLNSTSEITIQELKENYPDIWPQFVRKTGRVVYILERKNSRCTVGYLKQFQDKNPNFALFSPIDNRFPRMKIAQKNCPPDFFNRPQDFEEFLFLAKLIQWDQITYGLGVLEQKLGSDKDIDARTKGILMENAIDFEDFPDKISDNLPNLPFVIPDSEIEKRRDFRQNCVFTIDPLTARDLDDALSIELIEENKYKVGVHIADVSYFVSEKTDLDREAENRATSVYLVQKVIPMLPRTLCEHLCSLNPGEDRLTFSVEWIINSEVRFETVGKFEFT